MGQFISGLVGQEEVCSGTLDFKFERKYRALRVSFFFFFFLKKRVRVCPLLPAEVLNWMEELVNGEACCCRHSAEEQAGASEQLPLQESKAEGLGGGKKGAREKCSDVATWPATQKPQYQMPGLQGPLCQP